MSSTEFTTDGTDDCDTIARGLRELRAHAGGPSYAEIGHRIAAARRSRGVSDTASLPARTTIYDAFRDGRSRINAALVREIVCALGATPAEADEWEARCGRAQRPSAPAVAPAVSLEPDAPAASTPRPVHRPPVPADAPQERAPVRRPAALGPLALALTLVACVGLNLGGTSMVALLGLPLFLDMIGTAVAAVALGPWRGVLVAVASTVAASTLQGVDVLPFGLVNIAGALVWGYGVHRLGMGRSLTRFFTLNAIVGVVCTAIAVPMLLMIFGGTTGHASDDITTNLLEMGEAFAPSVFTANLLTSVTDKLLTGFIALALISVFGLARSGSLDAITGHRAAQQPPSTPAGSRTDAALPV